MPIWARFTCPVRWRGHEHQEYAQMGTLLVFGALSHRRTSKGHDGEGLPSSSCRIKSNKHDEEGLPSSSRRIKSNRRDGEGLPSSSRRIKSNRRGGFPPSSRRIEPIDATGRVSPLRCVQWTQTDATGRGNPPRLVVWNESVIPSVSR